MKLTEQELALIARIKISLDAGYQERADALAKEFLEGAKCAEAIRRRAYLLLQVAGQAISEQRVA